MSNSTTSQYDIKKYKTPTGSQLTCKGWIQEAALRMLLNNLDPAVAERPDDLIVYGGRGKAAPLSLVVRLKEAQSGGDHTLTERLSTSAEPREV
jgi:hypothetical protein